MNQDESKMVAEDDLLDLFRPRRTDPEGFDEAVQRKIEKRQSSREQQPTARWQRAAATALPFSPSSSKGVGWILSLPFLMLIGSVLAFTSGVRAAGRRKPTAKRPGDAKAGSAIETLLHFGPFLIIVAPWLFGITVTIDVLMGLLIVAMLAFTLQVRGSGMAPSEVGRIGMSLLSTAFIACFLWSFTFGPLAADSDIGLGASAGVILLGIAGSGILLWTYGGRSVLSVAGLTMTAVWLAFIATALNPLGLSATDPDDLAADVANFAADPGKLSGWEDIAATIETLDGIGASRPDLSRMRDAIATAVSDRKIKVHPVVWTAAARIGLLTDAQWRDLVSRPGNAREVEQLIDRDGELYMIDYDEYEVWMLCATQELTPALRDHLAARIEATWPDPATPRALSEMLLCVHLFDRIGREDLVDAHRDDIHAAMRRQWVAEHSGFACSVGGFTSDPEEFATSFEDSTWAAVSLMTRVGVPADIDLRLVRAYLRQESRMALAGIGRRLTQLERATLVRVEREIGLPQRTIAQRVLGERVLIATSLLVLLCWISVVLAARAQVLRSIES